MEVAKLPRSPESRTYNFTAAWLHRCVKKVTQKTQKKAGEALGREHER